MLDRSVTPGRSPSSSVLSAGCCQWQPTAATPAKSNPPKYRKNSHTLSWRLSNTMDAIFCVEALEEALALYGRPEIFNSDQGAQFTSTAFTGVLEAAGVRISMDGKGRCMDNVFVERLWRSLKYEDIYLRAYATGSEARLGIGRWIAGYNTTRPHQALGYRTPDEVYKSPPVAGLAPTPIGMAA